MTQPKKVNGTTRKAPPPLPPAKKIIFQSDLPVEQSAYEGTVKALGYEPILPPYIDEALQEVYDKHDANMESLRELSRE